MKKVFLIIILIVYVFQLKAEDDYQLLSRVKSLSFGSGYGTSGIASYIYADIKIFKNLYTSPEVYFAYFKSTNYSGRLMSGLWRFTYYIDNLIIISPKFNSYIGLIIGGEKWLYDYSHRKYFPKSDRNCIKIALGSRYFFKESWALAVELNIITTYELRIGLNKTF